MNVNCVRTLVVGIVFSCLVTPLTGFSHESTDLLHTTPIETVDSRLARPTGIHVQVTDQGVEVKGKVQRKGPKSLSLRGHVDVELLDALGRVLVTKIWSIRHRSGPARNDNNQDFSVVLPLPGVEEYSVRVRHSIAMDDHGQNE